MSEKLIETSDRGITLNKSLAWTMLSALAVLIWWGGSTVSKMDFTIGSLVKSTDTTAKSIAEERLASQALEARVRLLENSSTRQDARFESLYQSLEEVKQGQKETNSLLRQVLPR